MARPGPPVKCCDDVRKSLVRRSEEGWYTFNLSLFSSRPDKSAGSSVVKDQVG